MVRDAGSAREKGCPCWDKYNEGFTRKSKPGKIRNDDVSSTGPAGGNTSWRERYRNECTVGGSKYVRNRSYADVTGGRSTGRPR